MNYFESFKVNTLFWKIVAVDAVFFGSISYLFLIYTQYMQNTSTLIMQGLTPQQLQQLILSSPEKALPLLESLKSFLITMIVIGILLVVFTFVSFSTSRGIIWNTLAHKKLQVQFFSRWNILNLALLVPILIYGLVFFVVSLLFRYVFQVLLTASSSFYIQNAAVIDAIILILDTLVRFSLLVLLLMGLFFIYREFQKSNKVWVSLGNALRSFKMKKTWWKLVMIVLTLGILSTLLFFLREYLFIYPTVSSLIYFAVSILAFNWMRRYTVSF